MPFDVKHADATNIKNLKATQDGGSVAYKHCKQYILIGAGHKKENVDIIDKGNPGKGVIVVDKGSILDKGELTVTGAVNKLEFKEGIARISKKKVTFK